MAQSSDSPNTDEQLILESIDRFLEREVAPVARELEATDTYPARIVEQLAELGLFGATISTEYGGLGLSAITYARIVERVSAVWMSISGLFNSHLIMAAAVQRFGTEEQRQRFLPRFARGELRGGVALTEPDCGTDLQSIRTTASRGDGCYVINGTKSWITNSIHGQVLAVLVKTDTEAVPPHRGMSLLLTEKEDGFRINRKLEKLGYRGIDTAELVFEDCAVPVGNLIGGDEGRGLQQILSGLELGRINVADMATRVEAARLLTDSAAKAYDRGQRCDVEAGMAKLFATEAALSNSLEAMRIHGANGYSRDYNIERYYRDAPLLAIGEGTNELQRIIIARQLVERSDG